MSSFYPSARKDTLFQVNPDVLVKATFGICLVLELGLVFLDAAINYGEWIEQPPLQRLVNITREDGVASWFAVTQTFVVALLCWALAFVSGQRDRKPSNMAWGWVVSALIFTYLAFDDGSKFHERVATAFDYSVESLEDTDNNNWLSIANQYPSYSWQLLFLPVFGLLGGFLLWFLWKEFPQRIDKILLATAFGCLATAVGLDFLEGLNDGYHAIQERYGLDEYTVSHFSKSLEEFLEMFAMTCFLAVFFRHLTRVGTTITLAFRTTVRGARE